MALLEGLEIGTDDLGAEGIHIAIMGGSIDLLQRCFTAPETRADRLMVGATIGVT